MHLVLAVKRSPNNVNVGDDSCLKNRSRINHVLNVVRVEHALNVADELWPSKKPLNQQVGSISANKCIEGVVYTPASLWSSKNWRPWQQGRHQCRGCIDGDIAKFLKEKS